MEQVADRYLKLRENALNYTNEDMNLALQNDSQVYIAVFDIPVKSGVEGNSSQSLILIFGLNVHVYFSNGEAITKLEENPNVMKAMQSLFISCPQVLDEMTLTNDVAFYPSNQIRAYLKTRRGIFYKELDSNNKKDCFLEMLMRKVIEAINEN